MASFCERIAGGDVAFDAGSSNSTIVAGVSVPFGGPLGFSENNYPQVTAFVENGGVLNVAGPRSAVTLVAGAGAGAGAATGDNIFLATSGNTSLGGGGGGNAWFVAGRQVTSAGWQITLTDQTQITLAGVTCIGAGLLHFG